MADGTVIIDTLLDSTGFENGVGKLKSLASKGAGLATKGIATIGTALTGLGVYAVKVGSDFEEGMSKVQAISGATSEEMQALSAKAKEMGASTKFSATESAEALQYMAMAGWKSEQMINGLPGIMNLAAASGEDLALTSDIVTDALTAFGMKAEESSHFADILAAASSNSNTNVAMLGESFKYVAPVCGALGYSAEDTSIALGLMANSGIKASQAGTTLKTALTNMAKPTKKMKAAMDEYHISLQNSDGSMKSLKEVMDMLRTNIGGLDLEMTKADGTLKSYDEIMQEIESSTNDTAVAQKVATAATIFGKESMSGMLAIINASESDYQKLTDAIYNCDGAAVRMAATMQDNLKGQVTLLKSALEGLGIEIYESVDNPMKDVVKTANLMIADLMDAFKANGFQGLTEELGTVFSKIIEGIASSTPTIIDASVSVIESFIQGIYNYQDSLTQSAVGIITSLTKGIMDILPQLIELGGTLAVNIIEGLADKLPELVPEITVAITSLVQAIISNADLFVEAGAKLTAGLAEGLSNAIPGLSGIFSPIKEAFLWIADNSESVISAIIGIATAFTTLKAIELGTAIISAVAGFIQFIPVLISAASMVKSFAGAMAILNAVMAINPFVLIASAIAGLVVGIIYLWNTNEGFRDAVIGAWNSISSACSSIWGSIVSFFTETIPSALNSVIDFISGNWQNLLLMLVNPFVGGFGLLYDNCDGFRAFVDGFVQSICSFFTETIPSAIEAVGEWFAQLPTIIAYGLGEAVGSIASWAVETYDSMTTSVSDAINAAGEWFSNLPSAIANGLSSALSALISWGSNMLSSAVSSCQQVVSGIANTFTSLPGKMAEIGSNIVAGIKNGISNAWNGMVGWIGGLCDGFVSGVKAKFDIHSPSRVMRDQVGKNIIAGIEVGMEQQSSSLRNTATNICTQLTNQFGNILNKQSAEDMINRFKSVTGVLGGLTKELNTAQERVDWANGLTLDDNKWYYDAKTRLEDVKYQLEELSDQISDTEDKNTKKSLQEQQKALQKKQKLIQKEYDYYKEAAQNEINERKEATKKELEIAKEKYSKLEDLSKALTTAIKNQINEQKNAAISAIEAQEDAAEKAYNKQVEKIESTTKKKVDSIQSKIDALEEEEEAENRLQEVQEANNNIAVLQAKMNNTASEADKKAYAIKIKNAKAALTEKEKEWDREDEKKKLQEKIDNINSKAEAQKEALKEEYEATKEKFDEQIKAAEEYYEKLLETDSINAQARYMLLTRGNDELVQLLQSYNPLWQDAGQSLADSLINGLNSKKGDMASAVAEMTSMRNGITIDGYATGTSSNRIAGAYTVDEKGFELSTNNNPVAYVSKGAGIMNHMQSLKAVKNEVSSQVATQMSALKNMVLGQQQQMYQLAGAIAGTTNTSSTDNSIGTLFHADKVEVRNQDDIKSLASELGFHAQRNKRC